MFWVVVYDAEPGSRWDFSPQSFLNHDAALQCAIDWAWKFAGAADAPQIITMLLPDGGKREWPVERLIWTAKILTK